MRKHKNISQSRPAELPLPDSRPILDVLRPVRVEQWHKEERLFRAGKFSIRHKIRFVCALRSRAFDCGHKNIGELSHGGKVSPIEIAVSKKLEVVKKFNVIQDTRLREIMIGMICTENLLTARYVAKKAGYIWPQFVFDFNDALDQMIDAQQKE